MAKVWFDWGSGLAEEIQCYEFPTHAELNAFLEGVTAASTAFGLEDFTQMDTEEEVEEHKRAMAAEGL